MSKLFAAICPSCLSALYNYFDGSTESISNLYLIKILNISTKPFSPREYRFEYKVKLFAQTDRRRAVACGAKSTRADASDGAKRHVCCTKEIYDCRWLRRPVLKGETRDYPAERLPSSGDDDYIFLIGSSAIRCTLPWRETRASFDAYKPPPRLFHRGAWRTKQEAAHRDRNSPKLDFRSLLASRRRRQGSLKNYIITRPSADCQRA